MLRPAPITRIPPTPSQLPPSHAPELGRGASDVRARLAAVARGRRASWQSSDVSNRLFWVSVLFSVNGAFCLVGVVLLTFALVGPPVALLAALRSHLAMIVGGLVVQAVSGASYLWTGHLLRARARQGGIVAVAAFALALIASVARGGFSLAAAVFPIIGLLLIASVWNELE